jgi:hypothetical protein
MPNPASAKAPDEKPSSLAGKKNSEHIINYPRMQRGTYFADFMRDKRMHPEIYHCVIQREGSKEILWWTQHRTLEGAMKHAEVALAAALGPIAAEA